MRACVRERASEWTSNRANERAKGRACEQAKGAKKEGKAVGGSG